MYSMNYVDDSMFYGIMATFSGIWLGCLLMAGFMIIAQWLLFKKAGEPGWASLVPFYNSFVLYKITFGNGWLFLLALVPFVNIVISILQCFKLAKAFGKGTGFGFGLLFLNSIFYAILAFGHDPYYGPDGTL